MIVMTVNTFMTVLLQTLRVADVQLWGGLQLRGAAELVSHLDQISTTVVLPTPSARTPDPALTAVLL